MPKVKRRAKPKFNSSICVYGPASCGKTTNGKRIQKALGLEFVVEAEEFFSVAPSRRKIPAFGVLLLCETPPAGIQVQTMSYKDAMRAVEAELTPNAELCGGPSGPSERAPGYASGGKD